MSSLCPILFRVWISTPNADATFFISKPNDCNSSNKSNSSPENDIDKLIWYGENKVRNNKIQTGLNA